MTARIVAAQYFGKTRWLKISFNEQGEGKNAKHGREIT
jgi:hypothetical protein